MRFWDSSAIVPLICSESSSLLCNDWLRSDSVVIVWTLAGIEVVSALARKRRDKTIDRNDWVVARSRLSQLEEAWNEVDCCEVVKTRAVRLLDVHPLRTADALHLAAAIVITDEHTSTMEFVTLDQRLADSAEREGFKVLR